EPFAKKTIESACPPNKAQRGQRCTATCRTQLFPRKIQFEFEQRRLSGDTLAGSTILRGVRLLFLLMGPRHGVIRRSLRRRGAVVQWSLPKEVSEQDA